MSGPDASTGKVISELFHSLTGVINKTGELISKLSDIADYEVGNNVGKEVTAFGDQLDDDTAEMITSGLNKFLEYIPQIKNNVTNVLEMIPGIQKKVADQINMLPENDAIKEKVNSFLDTEFVGTFVADDDLDYVKSAVGEHIDSWPSNAEVNEMIDDALDNIPSADYIHSKIDEVKEHAEDVIDGFNEADIDGVDM